MLPFIIGGIAITAAGYTLKKYCEDDGDGCDKLTDTLLDFSDWMENMEQKLMGNGDMEMTVPADAFFREATELGKLGTLREDLYHILLLPYVSLRKEMNNTLKEEALVCKKPKPIEARKLTLSKEEQDLTTQYKNALNNASKHLSEPIKVLMQEMQEGEESATLTDANKEMLTKADAYAAVLCKLLGAKVCKKDGTLSKKLKAKVSDAMQEMMQIEA